MVDGLDRLADIQALREAAQRPPAEVQRMQPPSPQAGLQSLGQQEVDMATGMPVGFSPANAVGQVTNIAGQYAMANPQKTGPFAAALAAFGAGSEAANMIDKRVEVESERENLDAVKNVATSLPDRTRTNIPAMAMPVQAQEEIQVTEASPMQAGLASVMPMKEGGVLSAKNKKYFRDIVSENEFDSNQYNDPKLFQGTKDNPNAKYVVYKDTEQNLTVGKGVKIDKSFLKKLGKKSLKIGDTVPQNIVDNEALARWETALKDAKSLAPNLSDEPLMIYAEMAYQLGKTGLSKFKDLKKELNKDNPNFEVVANDVVFNNRTYEKPSSLALQTPKRAEKYANKFASLENTDPSNFPSLSPLERLASLEQTSMETPNIYKQYTVKEGDNLTTIANKLGTTLEEIRNVNDDITLANQDNISINQKINIPGMENDSFIRDVPEQSQDQSILDTIKSYGSEGISTVREFFGLREGGDVGEYFEGQVEGKGDGMSDEIPFRVEGGNPDFALLSKDEYVIPADVVSMLGNGSSDAGADELDDFLKDVRKEAFGREEQQKEINAEKGLSSIA